MFEVNKKPIDLNKDLNPDRRDRVYKSPRKLTSFHRANSFKYRSNPFSGRRMVLENGTESDLSNVFNPHNMMKKGERSHARHPENPRDESCVNSYGKSLLSGVNRIEDQKSQMLNDEDKLGTVFNHCHRSYKLKDEDIPENREHSQWDRKTALEEVDSRNSDMLSALQGTRERAHKSANSDGQAKTRPGLMLATDDTTTSPSKKCFTGSKNGGQNTVSAVLKESGNFALPKGPVQAEKYTIVFTNETLPYDPCTDKQTESLEPVKSVCEEKSNHLDNSGPNTESLNKNRPEPKQRKFVIRREKHESQTGEGETYTIHVSSQHLCGARDDAVSTSRDTMARKKETRGNIFRQTMLQNSIRWNNFESTKTDCGCHGDSINKMPTQGTKVINRLSSCSPPKRKNSEDMASQQRRAQSQRDVKEKKKSGRNRSKKRPIRLIDHLQRMEHCLSNGDHLDFSESAFETDQCTTVLSLPKATETSITKGTTNFDFPLQSENKTNTKQYFTLASSSPPKGYPYDSDAPLEQAPGNDQFFATHESTYRNPATRSGIDTIVASAEAEHDTTQQGSIAALVRLMENAKPREIKTKMLAKPTPAVPSILKKDAACQYSPPTPSPGCCRCCCHTFRDGSSDLATQINRLDVFSGVTNETKAISRDAKKLIGSQEVRRLSSTAQFHYNTTVSKEHGCAIPLRKHTMSKFETGAAGYVNKKERIKNLKCGIGLRSNELGGGDARNDNYIIAKEMSNVEHNTFHQKMCRLNRIVDKREVRKDNNEKGMKVGNKKMQVHTPVAKELKDTEKRQKEDHKLGRNEEAKDNKHIDRNYEEVESEDGNEDGDEDPDEVNINYLYDCQKSVVSSTDSSSSTRSVCKNNSANRKVARTKKNTSNSFRNIVDRVKRKSKINVSKLDRNSNFKREPQTDEAGHRFIGDYLLSLWKKQVLCDVRVDVNNTHFLAHKLVLAAFSDVFTPTTPYPEPTLHFRVPNSSPESVYRVFKYIYTATMDLKDTELEDTLRVGVFLGINEIKDVILEILAKPSLDNVEMYIDIQNRLGLSTSLMDYPDLYQDYLIHMIHLEKFRELTSEELETILRDPNVLVDSEVDTLHALASWVQYNPLERVPEVPRLLDFIIFEVISPNQVAKIVQMYDVLFSEIGARNKISEVFRFHALQLSSKGAGDGGFVENVPGLVEDPYLDRVSYIPSQNTIGRYQPRPTLSRPTSPTPPDDPNRNLRHSIRPSSKSRNSIICTSGRLSGPASARGNQRRSFNFSQSSNSRLSKQKPGKKGRQRRLSNRSNNSVAVSVGESPSAPQSHILTQPTRDLLCTAHAQTSDTRDSPMLSPRGFDTGKNCKQHSLRPVTYRSNDSVQRCARFTRRDHWLQVTTRLGSPQGCKECLQRGEEDARRSTDDSTCRADLNSRSRQHRPQVHKAPHSCHSSQTCMWRQRSTVVQQHGDFSDDSGHNNAFDKQDTPTSGIKSRSSLGGKGASSLVQPHTAVMSKSLTNFIATNQTVYTKSPELNYGGCLHFSTDASTNSNSNASSIFSIM